MSDSNEVSGVFDVIDTESTAHDPVDQTEVSDNAQAEGGEAEDQGSTEEAETKTQDESNSEESGSSEEGQSQSTEGSETQDKTKTQSAGSEEQTDETSQDNTDAEVQDWTKELPPPPKEYDGKTPEVDPETGQITNMTPQEYVEYITEQAKVATRQENYNTFVENRALDVAEKIIPDIKSNPAVRQLVENTRISSILKGDPIDTVTAALQVRDALGLAPERIEAAKAEGAHNAKVNIVESKNAALETGSTQKSDNQVDEVGELQKRIKRGDDQAFVELLNVWEKDGKL